MRTGWVLAGVEWKRECQYNTIHLECRVDSQATIASTSDRKSTEGKSSRHKSTKSVGVQSDQAIGDLRGSRIDEAMLQVTKHMAFVDLRRRLEASIYIVCRTELSHEAIL